MRVSILILLIALSTSCNRNKPELKAICGPLKIVVTEDFDFAPTFDTAFALLDFFDDDTLIAENFYLHHLWARKQMDCNEIYFNPDHSEIMSVMSLEGSIPITDDGYRFFFRQLDNGYHKMKARGELTDYDIRGGVEYVGKRRMMKVYSEIYFGPDTISSTSYLFNAWLGTTRVGFYHRGDEDFTGILDNLRVMQ